MSTSAPERRSNRLVTAALVLLAVPLIGAATLMGLIWLGPLGLFLTPVSIVLAVVLYRLTVDSTHSPETRAVAREVGAGVFAVGSGFCAWVAWYVLGVLVGVMPFITYRAEDHPYMDEWEALSVPVGVLTVPLTWWLLRRWADARAER